MNAGRHPVRAKYWMLIPLLLLLSVGTLLLARPHSSVSTDDSQAANTSASSDTPAALKIDLDKAQSVAIPNPKAFLRAISFTTRDGKAGWVIKIPGAHAIATPAYSDGMLFVGGGYGSHEFYAFNAQTGALIWRAKTSDDGPTAAVVEKGLVAFNTESCTVVVCESKTGKVVWQEWLGDTLMSQPAISKGRRYIAYPGGKRGNKQAMGATQSEPATGATAARGHRLLCADLKTGRHLWEQAITADVISAPVVSGDQVLFTCFDGVSFCLDASTGAVVWKKENAGTSAPLIADGHVVTTSKEMKDG